MCEILFEYWLTPYTTESVHRRVRITLRAASHRRRAISSVIEHLLLAGVIVLNGKGDTRLRYPIGEYHAPRF